jgi:hypothetical protein
MLVNYALVCDASVGTDHEDAFKQFKQRHIEAQSSITTVVGYAVSVRPVSGKCLDVLWEEQRQPALAFI